MSTTALSKTAFAMVYENLPVARWARGLVVLFAAAVITLGSALVAPSPALAATPYIGSNSGGANARDCASTDCRFRFRLNNGRRVNMICWLDHQHVAPPSSDYGSARWFLVSTTDSGARGFVHSSLVESQVGVRKCRQNNVYG